MKPTAPARKPLLLYFIGFAILILVAALASSSSSSGRADSILLPAATTFRAAQLSSHVPQLSGPGSCETDYSCAASKNLTSFKSQLAQVFSEAYRPFKNDWAMFPPVLSCPQERPLTRYGDGDGSKLLCSVEASYSKGSGASCLIYSLGSFGNFDFEQAMLDKTPCEVHTFDCTVKGRSIHPGRHYYHEWCLGDGNGRYRTWANITQALGHQQVDLLKMDIEGYEFAVLSSFQAADNLPKEISVEIHMLPYASARSHRPKSPAELALTFLHLANLGFAPYAQEPNPLASNCCEFTFMRVAKG